MKTKPIKLKRICQTYRMEWIPLINRHLKVSLELIKGCYLTDKHRGREVRITANNRICFYNEQNKQKHRIKIRILLYRETLKKGFRKQYCCFKIPWCV